MERAAAACPPPRCSQALPGSGCSGGRSDENTGKWRAAVEGEKVVRSQLVCSAAIGCICSEGGRLGGAAHPPSDAERRPLPSASPPSPQSALSASAACRAMAPAASSASSAASMPMRDAAGMRPSRALRDRPRPPPLSPPPPPQSSSSATRLPEDPKREVPGQRSMPEG